MRGISTAAPLKSLTPTVITAGFVLSAYLLLDRLVSRVALIPEGSYYRPSIGWEVVRNVVRLAADNLFVSILLVLPLVVAGAWNRSAARHFSERLVATWTESGIDPGIRWLIVTAGAIVAWTYSTYDYNLFYDRSHSIDRLLLVLLGICIAWRPVATLPFLVMATALMGQFATPLDGYSRATQSLLLTVVTLFLAAFLVAVGRTRWNNRDFVLLLVSCVGAHYFWSGWEKLRTGWLTVDQVHYLMANTYANGWLGWLSSSQLSNLAGWVETLNVPIRVFTVVVELGVLFIASGRRVAIALMGFLVAMHAGIFVASGILFWKWMLLEIAIVALILVGKRFEGAFSGPRLGISAAVILAGGFLFRPPVLSWIDSPISYTHRFQAIGQSGRAYTLPPRYFSPYDYQFTLGGFLYLAREPRLDVRWGATDRSTFHLLEPARDVATVLGIEKDAGQVHFDSVRADRLLGFVRAFVGNGNLRRHRRFWWASLAPPRDLWTFPRGLRFVGQEPVHTVTISEVTSWFDGKRYLEVRDTVVARVVATSEDP